jgi:hypothetical protein
MGPLVIPLEEERRRTARRSDAGDHGIITARVRPGHQATVIDVSAGGALIETEHRLLPGTSVELQMETTSCRASVRGRVLRCAVSMLQPASVRYRGAIGFERQLSWFSEEGAAGYGLPNAEKRPGHSFRADATPPLI